MTISKEIKNNLDYLKLPYLAANIDELALEAATKNMSHIEFFTSAISMEVAGKNARAAERRIQQAHLPHIKTLDEFDWYFPAKINRDLIKHLLTLNFIEQKRNVAFVGPAGTGKTSISLALAHKACVNGYSVRFDTVSDIIENLNEAHKNGTFSRTMKKYTSPQLLLLDEIGFLPIDQCGANLLFQIITMRYERGSTIVTTNIGFNKWAGIFNGNNTVASGMLDRLLHHCDLVHIEGPSYRMKEIKH